MAITSYGYDGTMSEAGWSTLAPLLGSQRCVAGISDFAVTIGGAGSRAITVATGTAHGFGVADVNSAAIVLNATTVASGTRWDTVVIRRNWSGTGGTTTVVIVPGTATQALASGLNSSPGSIDDQPIALIQLSSASTSVQNVIDLRGIGGRPLLYASAPALPLASGQPIGTVAYVPATGQGNDVWVNTSVSGTPTWVNTSRPAWLTASLASGISAFLQTPSYCKVNEIVYIRGTVKRSSGADFADGTTYSITTLPIGFRPGDGTNTSIGASAAGAAKAARGYIDTSGVLQITVAGAASSWVSIDMSYPAEG